MIVNDPVTINPELTFGSVHADYVFRAYGFDILEHHNGMLAFLEALAEAHDAMQPSPEQPTLQSQRTQVVDYLANVPGASILDVELDLGIDMADAVEALCNGRPSIIRTFTDLRWLEIESLLEDHPTVKSGAFAKLAGLSRRSAESILKYYGRTAKKEVAA